MANGDKVKVIIIGSSSSRELIMKRNYRKYDKKRDQINVSRLIVCIKDGQTKQKRMGLILNSIVPLIFFSRWTSLCMLKAKNYKFI